MFGIHVIKRCNYHMFFFFNDVYHMPLVGMLAAAGQKVHN